jgi:DNA-binding CsgD family transcriptional regulator
MADASAPPRGFQFQSRDLDELRELIGRNIRPCRFHPRPVLYDTELRHQSFGGVGLSVVSVGPEVDVHVDPVEDAYLLQVPINASFGASCLERERVYREGDVHVVNPMAPLRVAMHPGARVLLVRIDKKALEDHARVLGDNAVIDSQSLLPEAITAADPKTAGLLRYLDFLREVSTRPDSLFRENTTRRAAEQMLVSLLLSMGDREAVPARPGDLQQVRRAEEFIDGHADQDIGLVDIVRATGVDARTLDAGFRQRRGADPIAWLEQRRSQQTASHGLFTARELEISRLVAAGLNNGEIASCLSISRNTVKETLKRIFRKADVDSRAELVTRLAEEGLLKP